MRQPVKADVQLFQVDQRTQLGWQGRSWLWLRPACAARAGRLHPQAQDASRVVARPAQPEASPSSPPPEVVGKRSGADQHAEAA